MANPFGELVDDYKLNQTARYLDEPKTQEDRARHAVHLKSDGGKNEIAANYVTSLKREYGDGVTSLCLVYNATGDTVHHVVNHDWYGHIGRTPYPVEIGNGQWGAFLHVHRTSQPRGSEAAVVYRGKNKDGLDRDYLIAWDVPWAFWYSNKAYCEVGVVNSFQNRWDDIYKMLAQGGKSHETKVDGCCIFAGIGGGTSPCFHAELQIPHNL